jgi:hypothetical protein
MCPRNGNKGIQILDVFIGLNFLIEYFMQFFVICAFVLLLVANKAGSSSAVTGAKHFSTPMHEIAQSSLYLTVNEDQEVIVSYAGKGLDLVPNDYITHADGVRLLTGWAGGIEEFLQSGEKEAVIPVVDNEDEMFGGFRLKGFMLVQSVQPRKLTSRRGETVFDLEEGGPAPTMKLGTSCSLFILALYVCTLND